MIEDKLDPERQEDLLAVIKHRGFLTVLKMLEESIERLRDDVLTVPLPSDPQSAAIAVYAKRCQAEGAQLIKKALEVRLQKVMKLAQEVEDDRQRKKA